MVETDFQTAEELLSLPAPNLTLGEFVMNINVFRTFSLQGRLAI